MKVKDLIKLLETKNENATVLIMDTENDNFVEVKDVKYVSYVHEESKDYVGIFNYDYD